MATKKRKRKKKDETFHFEIPEGVKAAHQGIQLGSFVCPAGTRLQPRFTLLPDLHPLLECNWEYEAGKEGWVRDEDAKYFKTILCPQLLRMIEETTGIRTAKWTTLWP